MNNKEEYLASIDTIGLKDTWEKILKEDFPNEYFVEEKLGGLYEEGLAHLNKIEKKAMGKYYTPDDVAKVMAQFYLELPGENFIDLCCGTGNLILAVLNELPVEEVKNKINNGNIYLYDIDEIAINICKAIIKYRYGTDNNIHTIVGDTLTDEIQFPSNSKIISNPPYGKDNTLVGTKWLCGSSTKEMYVAFIEKAIESNLPAVIITPHSYLGGSTFANLRQELNMGGKIFAFDNVPGNIFKGKKFGIFNSNEANSTRAAIMIIDPNADGFQIAPFIRFRSEDREQVLNKSFLESLLPSNKQGGKKDILYRIEKGTENLVEQWLSQTKTLNDLLSTTPTQYKIDIPNTCRYFTVGAIKDLNRSGKITIYCKDEDSFYLAYAFINSTLCYYYHRMCNGGITYPITLLKSMPIFGEATDDLKQFCKKMMQEEDDFIVLKKNAGKYQENIKFPMIYHAMLNSLLLKQINVPTTNLLKVHLNSCLLTEDDLNDNMENEED